MTSILQRPKKGKCPGTGRSGKPDGQAAITESRGRGTGPCLLRKSGVRAEENRGSGADPLRGVVIMTFVATASVTETPAVPRSPASRPNLVSVGTIIWLSSEL